MALIRGSGARVSVLHEHRLVDLWREYSARQYRGGWIKGDREEVFRFITWSNQQGGIAREIRTAQREHARAAERARIRRRHSARITTLADEATYFGW